MIDTVKAVAPAVPTRPSTAPAMGASSPHESARAHVAGAATYVDDIAEVKGTLHAAPILSTVAHAKLLGIDATDALRLPGVRGVRVKIAKLEIFDDCEVAIRMETGRW